MWVKVYCHFLGQWILFLSVRLIYKWNINQQCVQLTWAWAALIITLMSPTPGCPSPVQDFRQPMTTCSHAPLRCPLSLQSNGPRQWTSDCVKWYANSVFMSSELLCSVASTVSTGKDKYKLSFSFFGEGESPASNRGSAILKVMEGMLCGLRLAFFFFSCL